MIGKSIMCAVMLMGLFACSSEPRIEDETELSCPSGEPTAMNIKVSFKHRLKRVAEEQKCTLDFDNTYKIERKGRPNAAGKCSVVVSAVCK